MSRLSLSLASGITLAACLFSPFVSLPNSQLHAADATNLEKLYSENVAKHLDFSKKVRSHLSLEVHSRGSAACYGQAISLDLGPVGGIGGVAHLAIGNFFLKTRGAFELSRMTYFTHRYGAFRKIGQTIYEVGAFPGYRIPVKKGGEVHLYLGGEYKKMLQDSRDVYSESHGCFFKKQEKVFATLGAQAVALPIFKGRPSMTAGAQVEVSAIAYGLVDIDFLKNIYSSGLRLHAAAQLNRHVGFLTFFVRPFAKAETSVDITFEDKKNAAPALNGNTFELFAGLETGMLF